MELIEITFSSLWVHPFQSVSHSKAHYSFVGFTFGPWLSCLILVFFLLVSNCLYFYYFFLSYWEKKQYHCHIPEVLQLFLYSAYWVESVPFFSETSDNLNQWNFRPAAELLSCFFSFIPGSVTQFHVSCVFLCLYLHSSKMRVKPKETTSKWIHRR